MLGAVPVVVAKIRAQEIQVARCAEHDAEQQQASEVMRHHSELFTRSVTTGKGARMPRCSIQMYEADRGAS